MIKILLMMILMFQINDDYKRTFLMFQINDDYMRTFLMFQIDSHWYSFTREESRKEAVSRELLRGDQKIESKNMSHDKNLMITTMSLKTMSNMTAGLRCPNWDWESATRRPWLILRKKIPSLLLSSQQASWSSMMVKHNKKRMKICGSQFVNINVSPSSQWGELHLTFGNHQLFANFDNHI